MLYSDYILSLSTFWMCGLLAACVVWIRVCVCLCTWYQLTIISSSHATEMELEMSLGNVRTCSIQCQKSVSVLARALLRFKRPTCLHRTATVPIIGSFLLEVGFLLGTNPLNRLFSEILSISVAHRQTDRHIDRHTDTSTENRGHLKSLQIASQ